MRKSEFPSTPTILIADDNPQNLQAIVNALELDEQEYNFFKAPNGEILLKIAKANPLDLIITDWEMPVIDGITAIKALQEDERTIDIPIIVCTGIMTNPENLKEALDAGAVDFVHKPIEVTELLARVKSMLRLSQSMKIIKSQKEELNKLLLNIFPKEIVEELKKTGKASAKEHKCVSVLFTDFNGFTKTAAAISASELIAELNDIFSVFDDIMEKYNLEKIKTIGDAYLAVCGLPEENNEHAINCIYAGKKIVQYLNERNQHNEIQWNVRVGIHTGTVAAGVVGKKKYTYDIFGDVVNTASRIESNSETGKINISQTTYEQVKNNPQFSFINRGKVFAKGKGEIDMYFVDIKT